MIQIIITANEFTPCLCVIVLRMLIEEQKKYQQRQRLFIKFDISPRRLQLLMQVGNPRALEDAGGVQSIATLLQVKLDHGIAADERLDHFTDRIEKYVSNF
jgi:hypothetical protein